MNFFFFHRYHSYWRQDRYFFLNIQHLWNTFFIFLFSILAENERLTPIKGAFNLYFKEKTSK